MQAIRRHAIALFAWIASPSLLLAQEPTGALAGRVSDAGSGAGVFGVTVQVDGSVLSAVTGADGVYRIASVPVGARNVTFRRVGFSLERRPVTIVVG